MSSEVASRPLERVLTVLEFVAGARSASLARIAGSTGLPKPTVHRLLATMSAAGLVEGAETNAYALGPRLRRLLQAARDPDEVAALSRPALRRLAGATSESCFLTRLRGAAVEVVALESPETSWRFHVLPGKELPPHAAASAKAILAFQPEEMLARALAALPRLAPRTKTTRRAVLAEHQDIRRQGYAQCDGEMEEDLGALGVPVPAAGGSVSFSVGVTGPSERLLRGPRREALLAHLRDAARDIGRLLDLAPGSGAGGPDGAAT